MIRTTVRVGGLEKLSRMGNSLTPSYNLAVKRSLPSIGLLVEAIARDFSPVDTGRLRSSIGHFDTSFMVKSNPDVNASDAIWDVGQHHVTVGTKVPYATFVYDRDPWMDTAARMAIDDLDTILETVGRDITGNLLGKTVRSIATNISRRTRGEV
jgi:hypothetical protein